MVSPHYVYQEVPGRLGVKRIKRERVSGHRKTLLENCQKSARVYAYVPPPIIIGNFDVMTSGMTTSRVAYSDCVIKGYTIKMVPLMVTLMVH